MSEVKKTNKRNYSRPSLDKLIVVNNEAAIEALDTYVNKAMYAIYALDVILFYIGDDEVADAANQQVKDLFDTKSELFQNEIQKNQAKIEDLSLESVTYSEQRSKTYKVYSPLCSKYLKLIQKFDLSCSLLDTLWMHDELDSKVRIKKLIKSGRHMRNVSNQIINISKRAMAVAKSQGKEAEVTATMSEITPKNDDVNETKEVA